MHQKRIDDWKFAHWLRATCHPDARSAERRLWRSICGARRARRRIRRLRWFFFSDRAREASINVYQYGAFCECLRNRVIDFRIARHR